MSDKKAVLEQLETDLKPFKKMMGEAIDVIIDQDVSKYPILVVHQMTAEIGIPLIVSGENNSLWSVHASTLEEFATKQIVEMSKVDFFIKNYKSPQRYLCMFVLSEIGATFVFMPR